jgi:S-(hydroxymethyl)glutathione dehydrogenase/alcohol dehydrogenase
VAVIGCGGIGLSVVQGARIAVGAARIIAVDTAGVEARPSRDDSARRTRSTARAENPVPRVVWSGPRAAVDYAFEAIGNPATVRQAVRMTRKGGTIVMIGVVPAGVNVELPGPTSCCARSACSAA